MPVFFFLSFCYNKLKFYVTEVSRMRVLLICDDIWHPADVIERGGGYWVIRASL